MSEDPTLYQLIRTFDDALSALGCEVAPPVLEHWAVEVHFAMSAGGRLFHTLDHVFDLIEGSNAVQTLAAIFHDTIYLQVDDGLPRNLRERLGDVVGPTLQLDHDPVTDLVGRVFAVESGRPFDHGPGMNELLSAVFAARCLANHIPRDVLLQVLACIELTIPFRDGDPARALEQRLIDAGLPEQDAIDAVRWAQALANRDVKGFASADVGYFLDNTWKLLPESNATLRDSVYTIGQYATAMEKMRGFFCVLDPRRVYASYRGVPEQQELDRLHRVASRNLELGKRYLDAKVLAANVLRSLAMATGGDVPVSLLMGDLPRLRPHARRLEHVLPDGPPPADADPQVYRLLAHGRSTAHGFDLRHSPLAAYFYRQLGGRLHELTDRLMALDVEDRLGFLLAEVRPALDLVVRESAALAPTRRDQLLALIA